MAGKRASANTKRQERMDRCWKNGQARKRQRREAQQAACRRNIELRKRGLPTPWERAEALRRGVTLPAPDLAALGLA